MRTTTKIGSFLGGLLTALVIGIGGVALAGVESGGYNWMPGIKLTDSTKTSINMGLWDQREQISNAGSSNGGSVAIADPLRFTSTGTALFESSTEVTAGADTAFLFKPLNVFATSDVLFDFQNSAGDSKFKCNLAGTCSTAQVQASYGFAAPLYFATSATTYRAGDATAATGGAGAAATFRSGAGGSGVDATPGGAGALATFSSGAGGAGTATALGGNSGDITLDVGAPGATGGAGAGTAGTITVGGTNATGLTLGHADLTTSIASGTVALTGTGTNTITSAAAVTAGVDYGLIFYPTNEFSTNDVLFDFRTGSGGAAYSRFRCNAAGTCTTTGTASVSGSVLSPIYAGTSPVFKSSDKTTTGASTTATFSSGVGGAGVDATPGGASGIVTLSTGTGGAGTASAVAGASGNLVISTGAPGANGGGGGAASGSITIDPAAATGAATAGGIEICGTNCSSLAIGRNSITTFFPGAISSSSSTSSEYISSQYSGSSPVYSSSVGTVPGGDSTASAFRTGDGGSGSGATAGGASGAATFSTGAGGAGTAAALGGNSGNITLDVGAPGATGGAGAGTAGTITIGGTNATGLTLGHTDLAVTVPGKYTSSNTTTALFESSTVATGGTDTAFLVKPLNALDSGDLIFDFQTSTGSSLFKGSQGGNMTLGGALTLIGGGLTLPSGYALSAPVGASAGAVGGSISTKSGAGAAGSGATAGGSGGVFTVTSGAGGAGTATAVAGASGNLVISTGAPGADGGGGGAASGNITIDTAAATGSATAGTVTLCGTNASAMTLGRTGLQVSAPGYLSSAQGFIGTIYRAGTDGAVSVYGGIGSAGNAGATLTLKGGQGGTGDTNGGATYLRGGTPAGTGVGGVVYIGDSNTSAINIGATGVTTTVADTLAFSESTGAELTTSAAATGGADTMFAIRHTADLGSGDLAFSVYDNAGATTLLTVGGTGALNVLGSAINISGSPSTLGPTVSTSTTGKTFTISAGAGFTGNDGGPLYLRAGAKGSGGTSDGTLYIGDSNTASVSVGAATTPTTVAGTLGVTGTTTLNHGLIATGTYTEVTAYTNWLNDETQGMVFSLGRNASNANGILYAQDTGDPINTVFCDEILQANGLKVDTVFSVADTTGDTVVAGTFAANGGLTCDIDKFVVADGTGDTTIAGTLAASGITATGGSFSTGSTSNGTVSPATATSGAGKTLTVAGGQGFTSQNGGAAYLRGGAKGAGGSADGIVYIGDSSTASVTIGATGQTTTIAGPLALNEGFTCDTDKFIVADTTGNTTIAGTLTQGAALAGGSLVALKGIMTAVVTADVGEVASKGVLAVDFTISGVAAGDAVVFLSTSGMFDTSLAISCRGTAADTVSCAIINNGALGIDPASQNYTFLVVDLT
jgi:hypothetical protein